VRGLGLSRTARRVKRVREQEEGLGEIGDIGGEHPCPASQVRQAAQNEPVHAEAADRLDGCLEPGACAVQLAEALVRLGLRQSKAGTFASPPQPLSEYGP